MKITKCTDFACKKMKKAPCFENAISRRTKIKTKEESEFIERKEYKERRIVEREPR